MSTMDLKNKTVLVTGATSGIGMETAAALAGRGARVILGVRNISAAQDVVAEIKKRHPSAVVDVGPPLDLICQDSVRAFAAEINKNYPSLDILINNAGVSFMKKDYTSDGVGVIAQTNYLGPYTLTRLLEKKLIASKARVVTVASVLHRMTKIKDATMFLTDFRSGFYEHTKLANVFMAYELQRRLGPLGVTSVVADPGGVRSNIFNASPKFRKSFFKRVIDSCYSPPSDGATSTIHAATVKLEKKAGVAASDDLHYYARGLFTSPLICKLQGEKGKAWTPQYAVAWFQNISAAVLSMLDWPIRYYSKGALLSKTVEVPSSKHSYDKKLGASLWDASADMAKLPKEVAM